MVQKQQNKGPYVHIRIGGSEVRLSRVALRHVVILILWLVALAFGIRVVPSLQGHTMQLPGSASMTVP